MINKKSKPFFFWQSSFLEMINHHFAKSAIPHSHNVKTNKFLGSNPSPWVYNNNLPYFCAYKHCTNIAGKNMFWPILNFKVFHIIVHVFMYSCIYPRNTSPACVERPPLLHKMQVAIRGSIGHNMVIIWLWTFFV